MKRKSEKNHFITKTVVYYVHYEPKNKDLVSMET